MSVARQLLRKAAALGSPVPSPCLSICRMDEAKGLCEGCLRTLDEIVAWSGLPDEGKRVIWRRLADRARAAEPAAP